MPSRWSVSCCTIRAGQPVNTSSTGRPRSSSPVSRTWACRATTACQPGTLRQPSKNAARCEPTGSYDGLTRTRNGCGTRPRASRTSSGTGAGSSMTAIRSSTPTCGAATPTPGAACMVTRRASTKRASRAGSS